MEMSGEQRPASDLKNIAGNPGVVLLARAGAKIATGSEIFGIRVA
jgi:hypothetical protein